jgi:hypothetical protein
VQALDRPIPHVPFPRLNEAKDLEDHFKNLAARGLARWALFTALVIGGVCGALLVAQKVIAAPPALLIERQWLLSMIGGGSAALVPVFMMCI